MCWSHTWLPSWCATSKSAAKKREPWWRTIQSKRSMSESVKHAMRRSAYLSDRQLSRKRHGQHQTLKLVVAFPHCLGHLQTKSVHAYLYSVLCKYPPHWTLTHSRLLQLGTEVRLCHEVTQNKFWIHQEIKPVIWMESIGVSHDLRDNFICSWKILENTSKQPTASWRLRSSQEKFWGEHQSGRVCW